MKEDIFNIIHQMIYDYEKHTDEKPYVILIRHKTYMELRKYLEDTNAWRYLAKIEEENRIPTIFGVPFEISRFIIPDAVCMNKRDYYNYCGDKFVKEYLESEVN